MGARASLIVLEVLQWGKIEKAARQLGDLFFKGE